MTDNSRARNLAVLIILAISFIIPSAFLNPDRMQDLVSVLMLIFGLTGLLLVTGEAWDAFWEGRRDRLALGLYGLFALFLSVIAMRSYGIITRNVISTQWLTDTHLYSALIFIQFCGLYLFTRGSTPPSVPTRRSRWGQLIAGIIIGALVASSKMLEPLLVAVGRMFSRWF